MKIGRCSADEERSEYNFGASTLSIRIVIVSLRYCFLYATPNFYLDLSDFFRECFPDFSDFFLSRSVFDVLNIPVVVFSLEFTCAVKGAIRVRAERDPTLPSSVSLSLPSMCAMPRERRSGDRAKDGSRFSYRTEFRREGGK